MQCGVRAYIYVIDWMMGMMLSKGRNGLMSKEQYGQDRYQQQDNHYWLRNP